MEAFNYLSNIDVIFSGKCNMACTYCYIHKNKERMISYNKKIIDSIENGSFQNLIIDRFKEHKNQVDHMALWGAEPTLNAQYFKKFIIPILDFFPNLNELMFSTNALLGADSIDIFISVLKDYAETNKRDITLEIQFSMDGPEYLNDSSRQKGATKNTIKVMQELVKRYTNLSGYFHMDFNTKITLTTTWMNYLVNTDNKLYEFYKFFADLENETKKMLNTENIRLFIASYPTVVDPGEHTPEDGIIFSNFIHALRKIDITNLAPYEHPLFRQCQEWTKNINPLANDYCRNSMACSAGHSSYSIDCEGNIMSCHRTSDNLYMGTSLSERFCEDTSVLSGKQFTKNAVRLTYQNELYHISHKARKYFLIYILTGLVMAGQIDKKYLQPDMVEKVFRCIGSINCYLGAGEMTGSIYLTTTSYIHLFCHGATEEIWNYYNKEDINE